MNDEFHLKNLHTVPNSYGYLSIYRLKDITVKRQVHARVYINGGGNVCKIIGENTRREKHYCEETADKKVY